MAKVAVMGLGVVGSGVMKKLTDNQDVITRAAGQPVELVYGLDIRPTEMPLGATFTSTFEDVLGMDIVVECIGGAGVAYANTKRLLEAGVSVVTSNKELVSDHGDELLALARANGCHYLFEASVGGGVPILRPIRTCLSGNRISRIEGIVNGSTNYLLTRMDELGMSFPAALSEAKELGYVEANPAADVDGWDARRKLQILAFAAFGARLGGSEHIPTEGISRVTERDLACARSLGCAVKLIAHGERKGNGWTGWVHPSLLSANHPLQQVRDVFNGIMVQGDFVGEVAFRGRGAGSLPTASAIVGDLIEIARGAADMPEPLNVPEYVEQGMDPVQLMVRIEADDLDSAHAYVAGQMPNARVSRVKDMLCLVTHAALYDDLISMIASLSQGQIRTGVPIRII
ncbi:homoserine dehydrogenase [Eubacteriales bacterium OttesenSCG-928-N13]|nr:homoserine dehydrogenase [Eubacteriales bacterium OttesenSCG-928-N13]